jgi:DNA-binding response OmpR family regulator
MLLRLSGHETALAHDGIAACETAETARPDVVLLDIGLPRMDGFDVCRTLRQKTWGNDVVIVAPDRLGPG